MRCAFGRSAGGLCLSGLLAVGCANPAPPKAPSLHLAKPVSDLAGVRTGDGVRLRWRTPGETTDGVEIRGHLTAEICKVEVVPTGSCQAVRRVEVVPGASVADLRLSGGDVAGPLRVLGLKVTLLNGAGRNAGESNEVLVAAGRAPDPVQGLSGRATKEGALVQWRSVVDAGIVELERTRVGPHGSQEKKSAAAQKESIGGADTELQEVHLQAGEKDAGGTLDRTAKMGESYSYVAQRVERLKVGGQTVEARSEASSPVQVAMRDVFPPAIPQGLVAVQSEPEKTAVDLSWEPVTDADLTGYLVFRQEAGADGAGQGTSRRLTGKPVQVPGYRDETALAGQRYAYRVSAVDAAGNESAESNSAVLEVREP